MSKTPFLPAVARFVFTFALLLLAISARAQSNFPPERLTYQGFLVDGNGIALATNTPKNYDVIFRIYPAQTGGTTNTALWGEQQTVTVDKGYFSVLLGEGTIIGQRPSFAALFNSTNASDRYVGITVKGIGAGGADVDILPRLRLLSAPYAFLARNAAALVSSSGASLISSISSNVTVAGTMAVSGNTTIGGNLAANSVIGTFFGSAAGVSGLTASQIPTLDANKITSGTFADARLPANLARTDVLNTFGANQIIYGNVGVGTGTPGFPLTFPNSFGDKISIYGQSGVNYGFGVQPQSGGGQFQIHADQAASDIVFGYGSSGAMTETMRIKGNGSVGINTSPSATGKLHIMQACCVTTYTSPIWAILIDNAGDDVGGNYRGGFRFTDDGYLDATVQAKANNPVVARLNNQGNWNTTSDGRVKKDVTPLNGTLEKALRLRPVNYHFTNQTSDESLNMGFIAQEVRQEFPSLVTSGGILTMNYSGLGVVAIGAIQELNQQIKTENKSLRDSLDAKDAELAGVKERLAALEELVRQNLGGAKAAK